MLVTWLEARLEAAGVSDWRGLSRLVGSELALPAIATPILAFVVAPHCHGLDRVLLGASLLAILANAAAGIARKLRAAERLHRAEAGVGEAVAAIDRASRATNAVLAMLRDEVVPALDKTFAAAEAMTKDRRLSAPVRGRAAKIQKSGEGALAILRHIVEPPHAEAEAAEPDAPMAAPSLVALPAFAPLALAAPHAVEVEAEQATDGKPAHPQVLAAPTFRPVRPLRVLAAEHNGVHQLQLRTLLAQVGIEPEIVSSGAEVIEAWQREPWDLILLDMQMPEVNGLALSRSFRDAEARVNWPYTPILAVADRPTPHQIAEFAAAGIDGHVAKPILAESLFAAIESTMEMTAPMEVELARVA